MGSMIGTSMQKPPTDIKWRYSKTDAGTPAILVCGTDGLVGNITRDMADTLHLFDLRIRPFNQFVSGADDDRSIGDNGPIAAGRRATFTPMYIPTYTLNPTYYLTGVNGCETYLFLSKQLGTYVDIIIKSERRDISRWSLVGQDPLMLWTVGDEKTGAIGTWHFVIWRISEYENEGTKPLFLGFLSVRDTKDKDYDPPLFEVGVLKDFVKSGKTDDAINSLTTGNADQQRVRDERDRAINSLKDINDGARYLPMIIRVAPPSESIDDARNRMMGYVHASIPMSLVDILSHCMVAFYANSGQDISPETGDMGRAHARGDAVDISLAPYYATTGIAMKSFGIYSPTFLAFTGSNPIFDPFDGLYNATKLKYEMQQKKSTNQTGGRNFSAGTSVYEIPLDMTKGITTQSIFDIAMKKMETTYSPSVSSLGLAEDDQTYWHLEASVTHPYDINAGTKTEVQ